MSDGIASAAVARQSRSNLAFTLACLPRQRRRDMTSFYAFCRIVDDIADDSGLSVKDRRSQLGAWRRMIRGDQAPDHPVAREVIELPRKYGFGAAWFEEIIDGVSMDLEKRRYQTFDDLSVYCYKVAGVVGLVSLKLFGVRDPAATTYALNLGNALQLTNILRDIKADWENDARVYLPLEDLDSHGYSERDIAEEKYNGSFLELMNFEADRALDFFQRAASARPRSESRRLIAAEAMRRIYLEILLRMRAEGFRVYHRRYALSRARKLVILCTSMLDGWFGR